MWTLFFFYLYSSPTPHLHWWRLGGSHWRKVIQIIEVELHLCLRWYRIVSPPTSTPPATSFLWDSTTSSHLPAGRPTTKPSTPPAASVWWCGGAGLGLWRWRHEVSQTVPLGRTALGWAVTGRRTPDWAEGRAAEGTDATQTMRASKWGVLVISPTPRGSRRGRREQLDSTGTAQTLDRCGFADSPLWRVLNPDRSGGAGGLSRGGRAMGQCLTALVPQKIQKVRHKLLFGDPGWKVLRFTNLQTQSEKKLN